MLNFWPWKLASQFLLFEILGYIEIFLVEFSEIVCVIIRRRVFFSLGLVFSFGGIFITLMGTQVGKKFAWVIKNFSSLECEICYSAPVLIGDRKW